MWQIAPEFVPGAEAHHAGQHRGARTQGGGSTFKGDAEAACQDPEQALMYLQSLKHLGGSESQLVEMALVLMFRLAKRGKLPERDMEKMFEFIAD